MPLYERKIAAVVLLAGLSLPGLSVRAQDAFLPAFPGAQGWGALTMGGRNGRVIKVTNLNERGPGSFAAACAAEGPRIVVFDVSGVIPGHVVIRDSHITIAGQTAPGGGITLRGSLRSGRRMEHVVIRFIRVRPEGVDDAIQLSAVDHLILDHVSASWASDETIDLYRSTNASVQWCTIEESQWDPNTNHNTGLICGETAKQVSIHHNLFAHHHSRNPLIKTGPADVVNNIVYDVRDGFTQYDDERAPALGGFNIIGNYYKAGPSDPEIFPFNFTPHGEYYLRNNYIEGVGVIQDPWAEAKKHPGLMYYAGKGAKLDKPVKGPTITEHSPIEAYELVLARAGAFPRDPVTRRTVEEVRLGKGAWGRHEPTNLMAGLTPERALPDSDGDGMPDVWEVANGLNTDIQDDLMQMPSGYTAIEEYLNWSAQRLIAQHAPRVEPWSAAETMSNTANPRVNIVKQTATFAPQADDQDIATLRGRAELEAVHLTGSRVTDRGLAKLDALPNLQALSLKNTGITDAGLRHLNKLPSLRALSLADTAVTDAGLVHLRPLASLLVLYVPAGVSDAAVQDLKKTLPNLRVIRSDK